MFLFEIMSESLQVFCRYFVLIILLQSGYPNLKGGFFMASRPNVVRIYSCFTEGSGSTVSLIEVSISPGIPTFSVIGLCDSSIRESQGRF